jgi:hypothetical protein
MLYVLHTTRLGVDNDDVDQVEAVTSHVTSGESGIMASSAPFLEGRDQSANRGGPEPLDHKRQISIDQPIGTGQRSILRLLTASHELRTPDSPVSL